VKAYQETIRKLIYNLFSDSTKNQVESMYYKETTEIAKVQQLVPYKIPVPGWIPTGYSFDKIEMRDNGNDVYQVTIKYINGGDMLSLSIENNPQLSDAVPSTREASREKITVNGIDLYYVGVPVDGKTFAHCTFISKQGLLVNIGGYMDKQATLDFVDSME